eukprot:732777-Prymnesium_polylepis.2
MGLSPHERCVERCWIGRFGPASRPGSAQNNPQRTVLVMFPTTVSMPAAMHCSVACGKTPLVGHMTGTAVSCIRSASDRMRCGRGDGSLMIVS